MELQIKVWVTHNGSIVFGRGRADLLKAVETTGSISAAAKELNMSYRHAWSLLRASEERLGFPLLEKTKGGSGGGGAQLTQQAREMLEKFNLVETELKTMAALKAKSL